ncbi:MAG TPA: AAA family ATPase [Polyangiales bacterium]|nr:AAA family ATPase [Polyangiales bacterium]
MIAYVPAPRLLRELLDVSGPELPVESQRWMCVIFIDVVGYSALAEKLGKQPGLGPEALAVTLNETLDPCLSAVREWGGEVCHFAGDAFVAAFVPGAAGDSGHAVLAGASCAARCIKALSDEVVSARVIVGAGEVTIEWAEADGSRFLLLGGDTIERMYAEVKHAQPGHGLVLRDAAALLPSRMLGNRAPGSYWLRIDQAPAAPNLVAPAPTPLDSALSLFIPRRVRELHAAGLNIAAEYRRATIAFIQIAEPSADRRDLIKELGEIAGRLGGQIMQLVRDDKGLVLIIAWGLPGSVFADATQRALLTATECVMRLTSRGGVGRAGVATGLLYAGRRGTALRSEWAAVGEVPNLAALLMSHAQEGEVLAELEHERALHGRGLYAGVARAIHRKHTGGTTMAVPVMRSHDDATSRGAEEPIFGRTRELTQLEGAFQSWQAGVSSVLVLAGESGVGKTHIFERFLARVSRTGFTVDRLLCDQLLADVPYRSFLRLLQQRLGPDPRDISEWVEAGLRSVDYAGAESDLKLCAELAAAASGQMAGLFQGAEEVAPAGLRRLLCALLAQVPEGQPGTLLAIDDAQWLDPSSLKLLAEVTQHTRALVVLTARPELLTHSEWQEFEQRVAPQVLPLHRLTFDDTARLTCHLLQDAQLPEGLVKVVHEHALGLPLFTVEYLAWLRKTGVIRRDGRAWLWTGVPYSEARGSDHALVDAGVPSNLAALVTQRVDGLGPRPRALLKAASAIGLIFSLADLQQVALKLGSGKELAAEVDHLVSSGLLVVQSNTEQVAFAHAVIRQVLHEQIVPSERRDIHARIALQLEQRSRAAPLALLAYHFREAANDEKALLYLERAGRAALSAGAAREAVRCFERAAPLARAQHAPGAQASLHYDAGRAHLLLSSYAAAKQSFELALELWGERLPVSQGAKLRCTLHEAFRQLSHRWLSGLRRKRRPVVPAHAASVVSAYELLVQVYFYSQLPLQALHSALRTLNLSERYEILSGIARGTALVSGMVGLLPWIDASRSYARRALSHAEQLADGPDRLWTWFVVAVSASGRGEWRLSNELFARCQVLAERFGDHLRWMDTVANLGYNLVFSGQNHKGAELLNAARARAYALKDKRYQTVTDRSMLLPRLLERNLEDLRGLLARMRVELEQEDSGEVLLARIEAATANAWLAAVEGRHEEARSSAQLALSMLEEASPAGIFYNAAWTAACVNDVLRALDRSHSDTARAKRLFARFARVYPYIEQLSLPPPVPSSTNLS